MEFPNHFHSFCGIIAQAMHKVNSELIHHNWFGGISEILRQLVPMVLQEAWYGIGELLSIEHAQPRMASEAVRRIWSRRREDA
jgi:hypothetical protein